MNEISIYVFVKACDVLDHQFEQNFDCIFHTYEGVHQNEQKNVFLCDLRDWWNKGKDHI